MVFHRLVETSFRTGANLLLAVASHHSLLIEAGRPVRLCIISWVNHRQTLRSGTQSGPQGHGVFLKDKRTTCLGLETKNGLRFAAFQFLLAGKWLCRPQLVLRSSAPTVETQLQPDLKRVPEQVQSWPCSTV